MINKIRNFLLIAMAVIGLAAFVPATAALAAPADQIQQGVNKVGGSGQNNLMGSIRTIINTILFILGAIAVIMIIIGGLRYVVSAGDSNAVNGAKNTILYAVIGLIVAMLAYAIVNFVLNVFQ